MSASAGEPAAQERSAAVVGGLRRIHLGMIDAVLASEGFARVAALAARELGGAVAIVLPAVDVAVLEPQLGEQRLPALRHYVTERLIGRPAKVPAGLAAEVAVRSGEERLGSVALLDAQPARHAREILQLAALAALTAVTLEQGASVTQRHARASLLEDLRGASTPPAGEVIARAKRLGCDLSEGASALCVRPASGDAERVLAVIAQELPGALAVPRGDRVEALLPALPGSARVTTDAAARRLAHRLRRHAPTGLAPFERDAGDLPRALRVAELALVLGEREGIGLDELLSGSWRLLLRVATGDPGQLEALVDSTVGPALARDRASLVELLDTLRAYLDHGANMNATAAAIYAHRHTIAHRLGRIRELTGHDPQTPRGQAQLALGLQALAIRNAAAPLSSSTPLASRRAAEPAVQPPSAARR